jgi:hypothetical protein
LIRYWAWVWDKLARSRAKLDGKRISAAVLGSF